MQAVAAESEGGQNGCSTSCSSAWVLDAATAAATAHEQPRRHLTSVCTEQQLTSSPEGTLVSCAPTTKSQLMRPTACCVQLGRARESRTSTNRVLT